jgi:hypothetical protein
MIAASGGLRCANPTYEKHVNERVSLARFLSTSRVMCIKIPTFYLSFSAVNE